ncbi:hypothetical protein TruAng_011961 [Truncatella angustata]|nr:hypothetical protein TruAng_011961 [Truncatella angustata]
MTIWEKLLPEDPAALGKLDSATIQALELTCPKYSSSDRRKLEYLMESGEILHQFTDDEKYTIYRNIITIDCVIPSLRSFFQDIKYLSPCAHNFRYAVGIFGRSKKTITLALRECFLPVDRHQYEVQVNERNFNAKSVPPDEQFDLGRKQLWLFIMRNCVSLAPPTNYSGRYLATITPERAESDVLCDFAALAYRLGFRNNHIEELRQRARDRDIARNALLRARRPAVYEYESESFVLLLDEFEKMADTARLRGVQPRHEDAIWKDVETRKRSGLPYADEHLRDQKHLFLDVVAGPDAPISGVTSLFVRRCVIHAFLGCPQDSRSMNQIDAIDGNHTDASWDSSDSSVAVRSSELALVRRVSTCTTDEIYQRQIRSRVERKNDVSNSPSASPLHLEKRFVTFLSHEHDEWRIVSQVRSNNPSGVQDAAATYMTNRLRPFSVALSRMRPILPEECYDAAMSNSAQIIVLIPMDNAHITRELRISAEQVRFDNPARRRKRTRRHPASSVSVTSSVYSNEMSSTMEM